MSNDKLNKTAKEYADKLEERNPQLEAYNVEGFFIDGAKWQKKEMFKQVKYWFKHIGPFVFPEDDETLEDLINYLNKQ